MKYLLIIAVTGLVSMVLVGCGQGAGNTNSSNTHASSTDPTTSAGRSAEQVTTTEHMTAEQTSSFYRIPVQTREYSGGGVLECADKRTDGAIYDYATGTGEKASPVEQARRRFSRRIEEGDKVEDVNQVGPSEGYYGEQLRTVRVVRDGRVVALMFYKEGIEGGKGWLLDSFESCGEF